jgi:4,5-dihydroxyphthalate decarboxylase
MGSGGGGDEPALTLEPDPTLKLSMLVARYDRNAALLDGRVPVEGIELQIHEENNDRARQQLGLTGAYDAWEGYAGRYLMDVDAGRREFSAIPVFPKRAFRHSSIYVRRGGPVTSPADLAGRRVGLQHWATTAALWARAALAEEFGVDLGSVEWVQTSPGIPGWICPPWLRLEQARADADLAGMLHSGEIDAVITSEAWVPYEHPEFDFLLPDYGVLERDYFARTHVFPIMHLLLVRTSILDGDTSLARRLFDAWTASKLACLERLRRDRLLLTSMWFHGLLQEERAAAGSDDTYPWGFARCRHEVAMLLGHALTQGLITAPMRPEDVFHPSSLTT